MHLDINARLYSVLGKWTKCETELWCSQLTELQRDMVHSSQLCSGGEQMRGNQGCRGQPATQKPTKLPSSNNWQTRADELAVNALITQAKVEQSTSRARLSWAGLGCFSQSWFRPLCGVIGGGCWLSAEHALQSPGLIRDAERFWLPSPVSFLYLA